MTTNPWRGRDDGPGAIHTRWHHMVYAGQVDSSELEGGVAILGFESHEGTIRASGRPGAAAGPDELRHALAQMAFHGGSVVHDLGNVAVRDHDMETGQKTLAQRVAASLDHRLTFVLGGGHETTWATYQGLAQAGKLDGVQKWGVVSLDAHFQLYHQPVPTAKTVFDQIHRAEKKAGREFRHVAIGIAETDNTTSQFEAAAEFGTRFLKDVEAQESRLDQVLAFVDEQIADLDAVFLSVDLDVLPGYAAPGVSVPATLGVPLYVADRICVRVAESGKVAVMEVVGLIPDLDQDGRTARLGARLLLQTSLTAFDRPAADTDDAAAQKALLAERARALNAMGKAGHGHQA